MQREISEIRDRLGVTDLQAWRMARDRREILRSAAWRSASVRNLCK